MAISVLMSVYKKEKPDYLKLALESIYTGQTRKPDEIVLVEDGPLTEDLYQVIEDFKGQCPVLITFQFQENQQLGRALAKGVKLCNNELIARMDTDDIAISSRLAIQEEYMNTHPDIDVCGGWIEEFDDKDVDFQVD